jgi:ABC-2 type transport system ATP-binding protein
MPDQPELVVLVVAGLLVGALLAYCVIDIVRHEVRVLPKWAWVVLCFASVPLGAVIYLAVGRAGRDDAIEQRDAGGGPDAVLTARSGDDDRAGRPIVAVPRSIDPSDAVLVTRSLTKRYGDVVVLDAVDLRVPRGSVFGLVGPNGAGKTTLLHLVAGLRHASSGSIELAVDRGRVAVLPDTPAFEPWLTAREVVDLARALVRPDLPASATDDALRVVELDDVADRRVGGFSRGMLQRLGLATTIVGDPDVLLLDEPCSALDPMGRRDVLELVTRLAGSRTVVFSSHILSDVQQVCDWVGVLRDGQLLSQGPLADLLTGHASPSFVVHLRGSVDPVVEALHGEAWVHAVEVTGPETLRVTASSLDRAERRLVQVLAAADASVVSVVPAAGDLEHVFLELTSPAAPATAGVPT